MVFCGQVDLNPNSTRYLMISNAPNNPCQPRGTPWRPSIYFIQFADYKSPAVMDWTKPPTQLVQTEGLLHINLFFCMPDKKTMAKTYEKVVLIFNVQLNIVICRISPGCPHHVVRGHN